MEQHYHSCPRNFNVCQTVLKVLHIKFSLVYWTLAPLIVCFGQFFLIYLQKFITLVTFNYTFADKIKYSYWQVYFSLLHSVHHCEKYGWSIGEIFSKEKWRKYQVLVLNNFSEVSLWFQITTVSNSVCYIQYVVEIYNFWRRSKLDKTNKSNQKPDHLSMTA